MPQATMILTASGFSNPAVLEAFLTSVPNHSVARATIVTTACPDKDKNKWVLLTERNLKDNGFGHVDFTDFETELTKDLSAYHAIYVMGGDPYKLLQCARNANAQNSLHSFFDNGGVYCGVSAGSLIVQSSIIIANELSPAPNEIGMTDFTGFNFTPLTIYPHYNALVEVDVQSFEVRHGIPVTRLKNGDAVILRAPNAAGLHSAKPHFIIEGVEPLRL